jgi:hypothetical protein
LKKNVDFALFENRKEANIIQVKAIQSQLEKSRGVFELSYLR